MNLNKSIFIIQQMVNKYIVDKIVNSIKSNAVKWMRVGKYICLVPILINYLRYGPIEILTYPSNVLNIGITGGIYGYFISVYKHQDIVIPDIDSYTIEVIKII